MYRNSLHKVNFYYLFLAVLAIYFINISIIFEYSYTFITLMYSMFTVNFSFLNFFFFFFALFVEFFLQIIYNLYYYVICTLIYTNYESLYYFLTEFF